MKKIILFLNFIVTFSTVYSQQSIPVETAFDAFKGIKGTVEAVVEQNDGKIILGGLFIHNSVGKKNLLRLNSDGTEDTTFNISSDLNGTVTSIAQQSDGKILVGGTFTNYQGNTHNRLLRLNNDGTLDSSFNIGTGFNGNVNTVVVQSDDKILVGGFFQSYQGNSQNGIIRLNSDGSKDISFNIGSGSTSTIFAIAVQNDGKIIVGGGFNYFNNISQNRLIRLNSDGSKDTTFNIGSGFTNTVRSIAIQNDGKILIAGSFTSFQSSTQNRLVRLNADGTKDATLNIGSGFNSDIYSICIVDNQKIAIGGIFKTYNGNNENRFIKLNIDGTKDPSVITGNGFDASVKKIFYTSDQKLLIGGDFISYNNNRTNPIIRLNIDASSDPIFNIYNDLGFNSHISSIQIQDDNKIIVGGGFSGYKNITENRLVRLNIDKTKDNTFNTGIGFNDLVRIIKLQNDGKILVGGWFTSYNGISQNKLIRLNQDGTKDNDFIGTGFGINDMIECIYIQNDGKIYIGGSFSSYNGTPLTQSIIRLNTDGTLDNSFIYTSEFASMLIYSVIQQPDGKVLLGGFFQSGSITVPSKYIIRLNSDGTKDTTFDVGTGFNSTVSSIELQNDGKILVGGLFTTFQGINQNRLIRLNSDGSKDTTLNINSGFDQSVSDIKLQNDGKIIISGSFNNYNGTSSNKLIRLNTDGSIDSTFNIGTGFDGFVSKIVIQNDSNLLICGNFNSYNSIDSSSLIRLKQESTLDLNDSEIENLVTLYPNPSNSIINLNFKNNIVISNLSIVNSIGKVLKKYENFENSIDISDLSNGIYFLKIENDNKTITRKIIKQ